ncbi:cytochrome c oxidase subunit III [Camelimonas fluminis]|uniref:cytochrome-c oxidase n=1 Tax=Camelimonas fluminis TaxID=1576911 RepID=A0ABV7UD28_9HYPH|nr:cytochrome c oxidase subunit 3 [Camelimonas fluminis]GHE47372.1 cytochrome c oxidase subunit III [Camelimonas fluminis]
MADAHAKPEHDYHLLEPSPWPLVASVSFFVLAVGLVMSMKGLSWGGMKVGPYLLGAGIIGIIYVMISWWADVIREAQHEGHHTRVVQLHHRYGMLLFIASEVMFFVAWFWAYFDAALFPAEAIQYTRTEFTGGQWPPKGIETLDPWHLPLLNTLILLTSGTTLTWAHHAMLHNDRAGVKQGLWLTIVLGVLFSFVQAYEYSHAHFAFSGNIYGSTFVMATGFHGFHVLVGTIFLAVVLMRVYRNHFTPQQHLGFEFSAWYWHFVDVVWLFLFVAIYVWGSNVRYFH